MDNQRNATVAVIALGTGILAVGALILSGLGVRMDFWSFRTGFTIMRWSAFGGLGVIALSLFVGFCVTTGTVKRGLACATIGGLCGILAFAVFFRRRQGTVEAPPPLSADEKTRLAALMKDDAR